jgi:hypothetical protein
METERPSSQIVSMFLGFRIVSPPVRMVIALSLIGLWGLASTFGQAPSPSESADPRLEKDRAAIDMRFADELNSLAQKCDELKLPAQAMLARTWLIPRRYGVQYHFLPDFLARDQREKRLPTAPKTNSPEVERQFWNRFTEIRSKQADRLFELAKSRLDVGRFQESHALLNEALRENPDHSDARRILGYIGKPGSWAPQEREPKYSKATRIDLTFNWAPNRHGVVDSAHFRIRTNADSKTAVEAAIYLEECHDVWRIVYSGFWLSPDELKACFTGKAPPPAARTKEKFEVILFATREEYISQLEAFERNIAASRGYYAPGRKTSFFYADAADPEVKVNWAHEVSHQLFSAYSRNPPGLAKNTNFWVIEGAAMYMESLARHDAYFMTGGFDSERLQDARHRQRNLREHATLRELLPLGQSSFQNDPRIRQLYTASAGYTHFLLDGAGGKHRDAFLNFLKITYEEQDDSGLLEKELGVSSGAIEDAYLAFLNVTDADLQTLHDKNVKRLVLGRTSVTAKGLAELAKLPKLRQLDLTELAAAGDDKLAFLAPDADLQELSFFGVPVTSACGERLSKMRSMKELNLSGSNIDDKIGASLASISSLTSLYLSDTNLTNESVKELQKLKGLKELDITKTKITAAGVNELKKALPELKITQ